MVRLSPVPCCIVILHTPLWAWAATVSFQPIGPTQVTAGTPVVFELTVSVESLAGFNTADVLIGSNDVTDIAFAYSSGWTGAFSTVTTPVYDTGLYAQDVFVGGNNQTSVGNSLVLGEITVDTTGLSARNYTILVDHSFDGISTLGLAGQPDPLSGQADFTVCPNPECICPSVASATAPGAATHASQSKNRYLAFVPANAGRVTAVRVELVSSATFPTKVGSYWWVGAPQLYCENSSQALPPAGGCEQAPGLPKRTFWSSPLQCAQACRDWTVDTAGDAIDVIHVGDRNLAPGSVYELRVIDCACDPADVNNYSLPLSTATAPFGNLVGSPGGACPRPGPDAGIDVLDVVAELDKFSNQPCAILKARADLSPHVPDRKVDVGDITQGLNGFTGAPYRFPQPFGCP